MNLMTDRDPERGAADLLVGALTASTLLPFIQAIAAKGGEDVYAKVRRMLSKEQRKRAKVELKDAGIVTIVGADVRVILRMPAKTTAAMIEQLQYVRLPPRQGQWLRVSWDQARSGWLVQECEPPDELPST